MQADGQILQKVIQSKRERERQGDRETETDIYTNK